MALRAALDSLSRSPSRFSRVPSLEFKMDLKRSSQETHMCSALLATLWHSSHVVFVFLELLSVAVMVFILSEEAVLEVGKFFNFK